MIGWGCGVSVATRPLSVLSLCSGIGGLDLGIHRAFRSRTVCYVEREAFAAAVLVARMEEERLDQAPIWDDLKTFRGREWRGKVDLVAAGYPCQPFSQAGKQQGGEDPRHLWPEVRRVVREVDPSLVVLENVRGHVRKGLGEVLEDLHELGFHGEPGLLSAGDVGLNHNRERVFVLAYKYSGGLEVLRSSGVLDGERETLRGDSDGCREAVCPGPEGSWGGVAEGLWPVVESGVRGVADGLPFRVDQLRALGNGVVPQQAEAALRELASRALSGVKNPSALIT